MAIDPFVQARRTGIPDVALIAALLVAAALAAQSPHAQEPAAVANPPDPDGKLVQGPVYPKERLHPAQAECGETKVMVNGAAVVTPRLGRYVSQCRRVTAYHSDGKVLSQQEKCEAPAFEKCV